MAPAVYALGIMLWEMVTRQKPWHKLRHAVIAFRVAVEKVRPPLPPPGPACPVALLATHGRGPALLLCTPSWRRC